jgi:hypothetical protein
MPLLLLVVVVVVGGEAGTPQLLPLLPCCMDQEAGCRPLLGMRDVVKLSRCHSCCW